MYKLREVIWWAIGKSAEEIKEKTRSLLSGLELSMGTKCFRNEGMCEKKKNHTSPYRSEKMCFDM
jgi:hypothetical protein